MGARRQPAIVDIQILRAGQLVVLCVPGEFTTMAGRRLKEAIYSQVRHSPCFWTGTPPAFCFTVAPSCSAAYVF
jgi:hypothetical protein